MFFNHFVDILMILGGLLVSLGIIGGCFFLFSLLMGWIDFFQYEEKDRD